MTEFKGRKLVLPKSVSTGINEIETTGSVVIVGANGTGKSRLGAWIEFNSPQKEQVHRVSAQKSLSLPESTSPKSIDLAEADLLYGYAQATKQQQTAYKLGHRWGSKPVIHFLDDFQRLMVYLFSDHYEKSSEYLEASRKTMDRVDPPDTKLDTIKSIWDDILPHRELIIGGGKIETSIGGQSTATYNAAEMSDGERVIFYLIGQCLAAPKDGIIVIDEPELHLHRSIQMSLWNKVEAERPDCLFVYLTHDLDFATTRSNSHKIWLKSFDGNNWDWYEVPETEDIPEEVLLSILGSRKHVVFIEGDKESLDHFLFSHLYPECTVISCGGCSRVIAATRSFNSLSNLHTLYSYGIIDRDFRLEAEIADLKDKGIYVLDFSEIENLLLTEDVIRAIAIETLITDMDTCIEAVKKTVFDEMRDHGERIISSLVASEVEVLLSRFDKKAEGLDNLQKAFEAAINAANLKIIYQKRAAEVKAILDSSDYSASLRLFNHKGLPHKIAPHLEMNGNQYLNYVKRLISSKRGEQLRKAMYKHVPTLPVPTTKI